MSDTTRKARFARIWRGRTTRANADAYERYWLETGIDPLLARGAIEVQMLRDDRAADTEFMTISYWETIEAMTGGRGGDPTHAHHLDRDRELLIELPERVQILTILEARGR